MKASLLVAAALAVFAAAPHNITPLRAVTEKRRKAEKALIKRGRAPVPTAELDIIDAAEIKRERKAAKAVRDLARVKRGMYR